MATTDLIDIVNDKDEKIGQATIAKARQEGLIHRISRIMVENKKGNKILIQLRTTKLIWPNCWDNSAAGHVDAGEDYLTAAKRELFEEIGIDTDELEEIDTYFTDGEHEGLKLRRFNRLYKHRTDETPKNLQPDEVAEVKWVTIDEAKRLIKEHPDKVTDGLRTVISQYY